MAQPAALTEWLLGVVVVTKVIQKVEQATIAVCMRHAPRILLVLSRLVCVLASAGDNSRDMQDNFETSARHGLQKAVILFV